MTRTKWSDLPETVQRWVKIGFVIGGVLASLGSGMKLSHMLNGELGAQVSRHEAAIEQQSIAIDTLRMAAQRDRLEIDRVSRGVQYLVCRDQRREQSRSLEYCEPYWSSQDFLPPAGRP
jgi:hypothetical protein